MSDSLCHRLVTRFVNVRERLKSLLDICRINEHPSWIDDDDSGESYRFCGPYRSDIEELETSIITVSTLIDNLRHELNASDDRNPLVNYPLCKNGWTIERIEEFNDDEQLQIDPDTLALLRLQTIAECISQMDEKCYRPKGRRSHQQEPEFDHEHIHTTSISAASALPVEVSSSNLLDFPVEILLHILSYLTPCELISNVAPTCRYLAQLVLTRFCTHLDLSKLIPIFDVPRLLEHLSCLQSLTLTDWENDVSVLSWAIWFDILGRRNSNLHEFRFRNVLLCPIFICLLIESFPSSLQTIRFDSQQMKTDEKFDLILSLLGDENLRLQRLTASYQSGITNFGISQLVSSLPRLKELNLIYIEAISDQTVKILCDKHRDHLEILRIDGAQLTDLALDFIGQCANLNSLLIEFCHNFTGENFHIFQNFLFLKELSLSKLNSIPSECFRLMFNEKHRFEHLNLLKLGECHLLDDSSIQSIINSCPHLKDFTCSWAYGVTDVGFNEIVQRCHQLDSLSLIGCYQILGEILNLVPSKYLQSIKVLNFEQCNHIDDEILMDLYRRKRSISITNYYGSAVDDEVNDDEDDLDDDDEDDA